MERQTARLSIALIRGDTAVGASVRRPSGLFTNLSGLHTASSPRDGDQGMADCWVRVVRSDGGGIGDDVFVDGNYVDVAGAVGTAFLTDTGQHSFETVGDARQPVWAKTRIVDRPPGNSEQHPVAVVLEPV